MKKFCLLCLIFSLLLTMTACGSDTASESASDNASASEAEASDSASAEESASSAEDSALEAEEEEEPDIDQQFASLIVGADGVCLKLQVYNQKGTPVRNGHVTLTADAGADIAVDTDFSGYALLTGLALDTDYSVTVEYEDKSPVGTVHLLLEEGSDYLGTAGEDGIILLTLGDGDTSLVDLAITATDEDGAVSSFSLSRIAPWEKPREDSAE